jgi:hypothetical protein
MAMDFPASPTLNQVFTSGGVTYAWNGYAWVGGGSGSGLAYTKAEADAKFVDVAGDTMTGVLAISNTTGTSSPTIGALTVAGGVGIAAGLQVGGAAAIAASIELGSMSAVVSPFIDFHSSGTGSDFDCRLISIGGGATVGTGVLYCYGNQLQIMGITASSSATTGALVVGGGVGINGMVNINGTQGARVNIAANAAMPAAGCALRIAFVGAGLEFAQGFRPSQDNCTSAYYYNAAGGNIGMITHTAAATAYGTASSGELKEDLQSFDAGNIIDATEVYDFKWKGLDERAYGVIAQEAVEIYPTAVVHVVTEEEDAWGVDYSKYVPVILQELKALRARVAELEGK